MLSAMVRTTGVALAAASAAAIAAAPAAADEERDRLQSTQLISRSLGGGVPNGPSTNAVISSDRRYARLIAFESEASDLVAGDTNGIKDVFAVKRAGPIANEGAAWRGGNAILVSRGRHGAAADGPSYGASVSGDFRHRGRCIAFRSAATNLVPGDTNMKVDAFLVRSAGRRPIRLSLPRGAQATTDATAVTVSGNCSRVSFVTGGTLYTRKGRKTRRVGASGPVSNPSYAVGLSNSLVFDTPAGVYLSRKGTRRPKLVAAGGANPAFNDLKRRTLAYEKHRDGRRQILYKDLGGNETTISARGGAAGNGDSRNPVIGNSGYYVTFESDAANLGVNANGSPGDYNGLADAYLYTDVRDLTLVQSVEEKAVPLLGGGRNPSMSYYANYVLFDSPAPLGAGASQRQVYMRYLGPV
jgi:hypothetical protein